MLSLQAAVLLRLSSLQSIVPWSSRGWDGKVRQPTVAGQNPFLSSILERSILLWSPAEIPPLQGSRACRNLLGTV